MAKAILQYRDTPLVIINKLPTQLLFGHVLCNHLPTHPRLLHLHPNWLLLAEEHEAAFAKCNTQLVTHYNSASRKLHMLQLGDHIAMQNLGTNHPQRWDCTASKRCTLTAPAASSYATAVSYALSQHPNLHRPPAMSQHLVCACEGEVR